MEVAETILPLQRRATPRSHWSRDFAWRDGGRIAATGNSFAAPHMAGLAALVRSRHPSATPFEVKAILAATASPS